MEEAYFDLKGVDKPEELDIPHSAKTIRCATFMVIYFYVTTKENINSIVILQEHTLKILQKRSWFWNMS